MALSALLPLCLAACELEPFLEDITGWDPCSTSSGPADVEGEWTLTGRGSRSSCDDEDFNGDFRLSATRLDVAQSATDDANVDELSLASPIDMPGVNFSLRGTVRGSCVDFTTEEDGSTGFFRFVFDGNLESLDVAGQFTGEGPPGCVSSGDFRVTIH